MNKYLCTFSNNNSGGYFWIGTNHAEILSKLGWEIDYGYNAEPDEFGNMHGTGIYKESFSSATKVFEATDGEFAEKKAILEIEEHCKIDFNERGCKCCGVPFSVYSSKV